MTLEGNLNLHDLPDSKAAFYAQADHGGYVFQSAGPQTIYGRDMLHSDLVGQTDLAVVIHAFTDPPGMSDAHEKLTESGVVVITAAPGEGARTAALRLLYNEYKASASEYLGNLKALTADWATPSAARIPREPHVGYMLDLTEEDEELKAWFRRGLQQLGTELKSNGSCLVVVVTPDQWGEVKHDQQLTRITAPLGRPDAYKLVRAHIEYLHRRPDRLARMDTPDVVEVLSSHTLPGQAAAIAETLATTEDQDLQARLSALRDWPDYVRKCFNEDGEQWERALLWAVAALDGAPKRVIIDAARALLQQLKINFDLGNSLVKRDLTSCLDGLDAKQHDGTVSINTMRPGVARVVLTHIWQEYSELREEMLAWLINIGARGGVASACSREVSRALLSLAEHDDSDTVLNSLSEWADGNTGRSELIARLLHDAACEGNLQRPARELLLRWAKSKNAAQHAVVAQVCGDQFGHKFPERALVRLKWLFTSEHPSSRGLAGNALRSLAIDENRSNLTVLNTVIGWDREQSQAALMAFAQVVTVTSATLPQIGILLDPAGDPDGEVTQALIAGWRILFKSSEGADQVAALRSWFDAADNGTLPRERIMKILRAAAAPVLANGSVVKLASSAAENPGSELSGAFKALLADLMEDMATGAIALSGHVE